LAVIAAAYTGFESVGGDRLRKAEERQQLISIASMLRAANPIERESAAQLLMAEGQEIALPYVLEAARERRVGIRALSAGRWSRRTMTRPSRFRS
jgi:hypothetical protein